MGYANQVFAINFGLSGYTENYNGDAIEPNMLIDPTRNINIHQGGIQTRGGSALLNSTSYGTAAIVTGVYDYTLLAGTQHIIRCCSDGKVYYANTATALLATGLGTNKYYSCITWNNRLIFANGYDPPKSWDGGTGTATNIQYYNTVTSSSVDATPTDWATNNNPQQIIVHGYLNSEAVWAFGCPSKPNNIYVSKTNPGGSTDPDFRDSEVTLLSIQTNDGYGIVGGCEFQDRVFAFGKRQTYIIEDHFTDRSDWGYRTAGWTGGAASWRLIVAAPNDIYCMMDDGEIYSVTAANTYGDYKLASVTRPSYMDNYIKNNLDLSKISQFHGVYDHELKAIKWFVIRNGQSTVDTCLVFFLDREPKVAWTIHDNKNYVSGYSAASAGRIKQSTGGYKIYTGGYTGYVWKLEQTTSLSSYADNGNPYVFQFSTPYLTLGDVRTEKRWDNARLFYKPTGADSISVEAVSDDGSTIYESLVLLGGESTLPVVLPATLSGNDITVESFDIGYCGKRMKFTFSNSSIENDFFFSQLLIDFKPVGLRP